MSQVTELEDMARGEHGGTSFAHEYLFASFLTALVNAGGNRYAPNPSQGSPGESTFTDGSEGLFSMYLDRTEDEDQKMTERWKADADGILVFVSDCNLFLSLLEY